MEKNNLPINLDKYDNQEVETQIKEEGSKLSKYISNIDINEDTETSKLLKDTIKTLNIKEKKGILGFLKKKSESKFIDVQSTNNIIALFEEKVSLNLKDGKETVQLIKKGIVDGKEHIKNIEAQSEIVLNDIIKYEKFIEENNLDDDYEHQTRLTLMKNLGASLEQDKADAYSQVLQLNVMQEMQLHINGASINTKTSVTNTLRQAITQENILTRQAKQIKDNKEINDMVNAVKLNNANNLNKMVMEGKDLNQYEKRADNAKKIFDLNIQSIDNVKELNKATDLSRKLLLDELENQEKQITSQFGDLKNDKEILHKAINNNEQKKLEELQKTYMEKNKTEE